MNEQDFSFRLKNSGRTRLKVWLEPWGEVHVLKPGETVQVDARGPIGAFPNDALEVRANEESITLWGWGGSGVTIKTV